jgi:hypothetical protein
MMQDFFQTTLMTRIRLHSNHNVLTLGEHGLIPIFL